MKKASLGYNDQRPKLHKFAKAFSDTSTPSPCPQDIIMSVCPYHISGITVLVTSLHKCHIQHSSFHYQSTLVGTLERRHSLALVLVQRGADHTSVAEIDLAMGVLLPCQGVLHPVLIIPLGEVLAGVGTTGLLAVGGSNRSLGPAITSISVGSAHRGWMKTYAQVSKFRSSRVSTRSEFQIMLRSLIPTWGNMLSTSLIFLTPSSKLS